MNTKKRIEQSNKTENTISLWPQHLLCLRCLNGGGKLSFMEEHNLPEILKQIKNNYISYIKLDAAFDEIGARTDIFDEQTHIERKRDLDVLQKLGLLPGSVRVARDLYGLIEEKIPSLDGICRYNTGDSENWKECSLAREQYFEDGEKLVLLNRSEEEMKKVKVDSCRMIEDSDTISITIHHFLCIICIIGNGIDKPLKEDNLYELWEKMKENPDIPVTVIEGCANCMVCPPCHSYDTKSGLCFAGCHLRNRKKDLDVFQRLDLVPGDIIPAKELLALIYKRIPTLKGVCEYGAATASEWEACGGASTGGYEKERERSYEMG